MAFQDPFADIWDNAPQPSQPASAVPSQPASAASGQPSAALGASPPPPAPGWPKDAPTNWMAKLNGTPDDPGGWKAAGDVAAEVADFGAASYWDTLGALGGGEEFLEGLGNYALNKLPTAITGRTQEVPFDPEQSAAANIEKWLGGFPLRPQSIKNAVGFEPRQPTTDAGKQYAASVGPYEEGVLPVIAGGPKSLLEKGVKAVLPELATRIVKYDVAPQMLAHNVIDPLGQHFNVSPETQQVLDTLAATGWTGLQGMWRDPTVITKTPSDRVLSGMKDQVATPGAKEYPEGFNYAGVPTAKDIQAAADAKFGNVSEAGFSAPRSNVSDLANTLQAGFKNQGVFDANSHPATASFLDYMKQVGDLPNPNIRVNEMEALRNKAAAALAGATDPEDKKAALIAYQAVNKWFSQPSENFNTPDFDIDKFQSNPEQFMKPGPTPSPSDLNNDPSEMVNQWRQGLALSQLSSKTGAVENAISDIENHRVGDTNPAKAIQRGFEKILNDPQYNWTPEEKGALRTVMNRGGGTWQSVMDGLAKWGPAGSMIAGLAMHGGLDHLWESAFEGSMLSGAARVLGKTPVETQAKNVAARIRSQYNPDTGQVGPMRKLPLRPGLRPALLPMAAFAAQGATNPQQLQQQQQQFQDPLADIYRANNIPGY